jgi:putative endonuclease
MKKYYFVYIMASKKNGTLYTGMTNNLMRRVLEHKSKVKIGFTAKYDVNKLVYFEQTDEVDTLYAGKSR